MLAHRDLPDIRLVGIFWTPPADPRTAKVLGYYYPVPYTVQHYLVEIGGAVVFESALVMWLERATYYSRNRAICYVRHTPEETAELLGAQTWEESTEAQRDRLDARLRYELGANLEEYIRETRQAGKYNLDWYQHYVELTWCRRRAEW